MKRLRRKAKEQLCTDLSTVNEAIAAIDGEKDSERNPQDDGHSTGPVPLQGQIGEGKSHALTFSQRKRTL